MHYGHSRYDILMPHRCCPCFRRRDILHAEASDGQYFSRLLIRIVPIFLKQETRSFQPAILLGFLYHSPTSPLSHVQQCGNHFHPAFATRQMEESPTDNAHFHQESKETKTAMGTNLPSVSVSLYKAFYINREPSLPCRSRSFLRQPEQRSCWIPSCHP